jgi:ABC-2 type transport system ATP-binding protein
MASTIAARDLTKTFKGPVVAVTGVDLDIPEGAVFGLIGRNGAGKTTTLRLLMGLIRPDSGWCQVLGNDMSVVGSQIRQQVVYVAQSLQLPGWMSVEDFCRCHRHFYGLWDDDLARRLVRKWEMPWNRPVSHLSGGQQRQAAILLALAARPRVLLLDEPAAGLDLIARRALLAGLVDALCQGDGCTVVLSTHLIGDLERVADHIGMMDRGRLTTSARLEDLLQTTRRVQVVFDQPEVPSGFTIPGARGCHVRGPVISAVVRLTEEDQLRRLQEWPGARVNVFSMNLEDIFLDWFDRDGGGRSMTSDVPEDFYPS